MSRLFVKPPVMSNQNLGNHGCVQESTIAAEKILKA
jgi:hypothetical protein